MTFMNYNFTITQLVVAAVVFVVVILIGVGAYFERRRTRTLRADHR